GHIRDFFRARILVDMGVTDEERLSGKRKHVHGGEGTRFRLQADHFLYVSQLVVELAGHAANHGVDVAPLQEHDADERVVLADHRLGDVRRHAFTGAQLVVGLPGFVEAVVRFGVDDFEVHAGNDAQTELLDPHVDDGRAPDQHGEGQAFVDDGLGGAQYAFVFAVGIDHALDGR